MVLDLPGCRQSLHQSEPATVCYCEMLAKAMGWDKPETITASIPKHRLIIGAYV
jgi:hypothetical protein